MSDSVESRKRNYFSVQSFSFWEGGGLILERRAIDPFWPLKSPQKESKKNKCGSQISHEKLCIYANFLLLIVILLEMVNFDPRHFVFKQFMAEKDNRMLLYGWSIPYACSPYGRFKVPTNSLLENFGCFIYVIAKLTNPTNLGLFIAVQVVSFYRTQTFSSARIFL